MTTQPTVLVVEDEEILLKAIVKKLGLNQIQAIACQSGKIGLAKLHELETPPAIIWLDYYLKDMTGLDFVTKIKEEPELKDIPIIVVSNSANEANIHNMLALGVSKYLLKAQYRLDQVIEIIQSFIQQPKEE